MPVRLRREESRDHPCFGRQGKEPLRDCQDAGSDGKGGPLPLEANGRTGRRRSLTTITIVLCEHFALPIFNGPVGC